MGPEGERAQIIKNKIRAVGIVSSRLAAPSIENLHFSERPAIRPYERKGGR